MVYVEPAMLLGTIVEVKRSDGTWQEAVISDVYQEGLGCFPDPTENDYFTVKFANGGSKRILLQQELALFMRPVHDTMGLVVSQLKVLQQRHLCRAAAKPQEEEDFSATQNPEPRAASSGDTIAMPPPAVPSRGDVRPFKHRRITETVHADDLSDEDLLAACELFRTQNEGD